MVHATGLYTILRGGLIVKYSTRFVASPMWDIWSGSADLNFAVQSHPGRFPEATEVLAGSESCGRIADIWVQRGSNIDVTERPWGTKIQTLVFSLRGSYGLSRSV